MQGTYSSLNKTQRLPGPVRSIKKNKVIKNYEWKEVEGADKPYSR